MKPTPLRIVHQNSVAVFPDGKVWALPISITKRPLLILNPNEFTPEKVAEVLDSGLYRRLFCDPRRIEALRGIVYSQDITDKAGTFKNDFLYCYGKNKEGKALYDAYENAPTFQAKQQVLERYYDEQIRNIDIPHVLKEAKETVERWHNRKDSATKALQWVDSKYGGRLLYPIRKWVERYAKEMDELAVQAHPQQQKIEKLLPKILNVALPESMQNLMHAIGVQFLLSESLTLFGKAESTGATSNYTTGLISVDTNNLDPLTLQEEVIHYMDDHIGFSNRPEWIAAVQADSKAQAKELLGAVAKLKNKTNIFDEEKYTKKSLPAEFLVDLYALDDGLCGMDKTQKDRILCEKLPHTYPLYKQCIAELEQLAAALDAPPAAEVAQEPPTHTNHAAMVRASQAAGTGRVR